MGHLFPSVSKYAVNSSTGEKPRSIVQPSGIVPELAAKILILSLHALAASLPKETPEVWEETRRKRQKGEVSHKIIFEDDLALRLTSRLVRAFNVYQLFQPKVTDILGAYFRLCGGLADKSRVDALEKDLGKDLAGEVAASGIGRGG